MNLKLKSDAELTDTVKRLRGIISRPKWLAELPDKGKSIENSLLLANAEIARRREMQDAGTEAKVKADPSADNNGSQLNESLIYKAMEACSKKRWVKLQSFQRKQRNVFRANQNAVARPQKQLAEKIEGPLEATAADQPSSKRIKSG